MNIDTRLPTKLDAIQDAPEPLRQALVDNFPSKESVRLLVHAPTFLTKQERSPATVLAVNNTRWLVASEKEDGDVSVQKRSFSETLFLELTSILLWGELKIHFAAAGENCSSVVRFDTVGEEFYLEAIDLMLSGIDQTPPAEVNDGPNSVLVTEVWSIHLRNEARRYRPKGQRLLAATQWPAVIDVFRRELSPAGGILVTEASLS